MSCQKWSLGRRLSYLAPFAMGYRSHSGQILFLFLASCIHVRPGLEKPFVSSLPGADFADFFAFAKRTGLQHFHILIQHKEGREDE